MSRNERAAGGDAIVVLGSMIGTGCKPHLSDAARARGAADLDCPAERVSAYPAQGGVIVARGCGQWVQYACFYAHGQTSPACIRQSDPAVDVQ
jgi:hypothetical protein